MAGSAISLPSGYGHVYTLTWHLECIITGRACIYCMVAGYYSCYACFHQYILYMFGVFIFSPNWNWSPELSKYTNDKILIRIFKVNLPNVRVWVSWLLNGLGLIGLFQTVTFQTKRNKWIVPEISSMTSGKPRRCLQSNQASFHEETSIFKTVHASTLHDACLSFPFCRMVVFYRSTSKIRPKITLYALSTSYETG